jgi:hypothetical protein
MIHKSSLFYTGMWQWQNAGAGADGSAAAAANQNVSQPPGPSGHPQQGTGELQDMLQMLDPHTGTAPFEDLNMFSTNFE